MKRVMRVLSEKKTPLLCGLVVVGASCVVLWFVFSGSKEPSQPPPLKKPMAARPASPLTASRPIVARLSACLHDVRRSRAAGQLARAKELAKAVVARYAGSSHARLNHPDEFALLVDIANSSGDEELGRTVMHAWGAAFLRDERHRQAMSWPQIIDLAEALAEGPDREEAKAILSYAALALSTRKDAGSLGFLQLDALYRLGRSLGEDALIAATSHRMGEFCPGKRFPTDLSPGEIATLAARMRRCKDAPALSGLASFLADDYLPQDGLASALTLGEWIDLLDVIGEHGDSGPKSSATVLLGRQLSEGLPDFAAATSEKIRSLLLAINALGGDHTLKSTAVGNWLGVGETWTTLDGATQTQIVRIIEGGPQSEESRTGLQQLSESSMARHAKEEMPLGEYRVMVSLFKRLGGEKQASGWAWGAYRRFVSGKRRDEMPMETFLVVTAILGESGVRPQGNDMAHIRSLALGFLRNDGQTGRDFDRLLAASGLTDAGLDEAESKVLLDALARWGNRSHEISDATFADLAKLLGTKHGKVALQESLFDGQGRANLLVVKVLAWQARSQHRRPSDDYGEVRALLKRLNQSSVSRKQQGDELAQTELAKAYVVGMIGPKVYRQRGREQIERALLAAQSGEMKARCLEELMVIASSREIRDRVRQLMRELEPGLGTNQLADLRSRWSALAPGDGAVERASGWRKRFDAAERGLVRQASESKLASRSF